MPKKQRYNPYDVPIPATKEEWVDSFTRKLLSLNPEAINWPSDLGDIIRRRYPTLEPTRCALALVWSKFNPNPAFRDAGIKKMLSYY